ncbi:ATP-grasp domain-containing protein [Marinobacter sp. M216]|uniref:ATP-grasp domain-containing protein n=1 Tax=Marinobacter albus TaxID=3030833 RepID=A0ABT7HAJ1_9GAMM|nr:ATP-grasp domain-containing protein [Marinobacter sp. M216]MDK9556999.1 ATP-grasp domain-containing protein [Marinobacter sp. M216]
MESSRKNIFVFGSDDFNLSLIRALDTAGQYELHSLFSYGEVKGGDEFPVKALYEGALARLNAFPGTVDAIVGYWDFPVSTLLPLLRAPFGLPSPSFESVLKCEHKYWSRLEQARVVPDHIPDFCVVDPFSEDYRQQISIPYPFWIKPVKAASSYLGFNVHNDADLDHAIAQTRRGIARFSQPFNYLLQFANLPEDIAPVDGNHCIVESMISEGRQCTLEGYVHAGEMTVYGNVDSIREGKHHSSFSRYQYPSSIPHRVQNRMISVTEQFLSHIDFDNGPFNIEYYWNQNSDRIWLLEINTRISKSHCPLFLKVDGASHHKVMVETALGRKPDFPHRKGRFRVAAKFMWRVYGNARVKKVPSADQIAALQERFLDADIQLHIKPGMALSDLKDQDSYSYEIAIIYMGADSQKELLQKYRDVTDATGIELEDLHSGRGYNP